MLALLTLLLTLPLPPHAITAEPGDTARQLVAQLDASTFERRSAAGRDLLALGTRALPEVIGGLSHSSSEVRQRARWILAHYTLSEVAPPMLEHFGDRATRAMHTTLREHAARHLAIVLQRPHAERLLQIWNTSAEQHTTDVLKALEAGQSADQLRHTVERLLELDANIDRFDHWSSRLAQLGLSAQHQDSTGAWLTRLLAAGLREHTHRAIAFAEAYVEACEALRDRLLAGGSSEHAVRQEVQRRADWSRGAMIFLIRNLADDAPQRVRLAADAHLALDDFQQSFMTALAAPQAPEFIAGVGKVHIVDMLSEELTEWTEGREQPLIAQLIARTADTARSGDKPRALSYLDALEACRTLPQHGLHLQEGVGQQLAQRLVAEALSAPHFKAYHPARSVHDRFLSLVKLGVDVEHPAFPQEFYAQYREGAPEALGEPARQGLERYVRLLNQLQQLDAQMLSRAEATPLLEAMNRVLSTEPQRLTHLLAAVERHRGHPASAPPLNEWTALLATR